MSYFQEDMNDDPFFSDESGDEEVFENDTVEEDSFPEEARYNPLRPAYLQLPLGIPERDQPRRQARMNSNKLKKRKAEHKNSKPKSCCLGGHQPKTNTHNNNL